MLAGLLGRVMHPFNQENREKQERISFELGRCSKEQRALTDEIGSLIRTASNWVAGREERACNGNPSSNGPITLFSLKVDNQEFQVEQRLDRSCCPKTCRLSKLRDGNPIIEVDEHYLAKSHFDALKERHEKTNFQTVIRSRPEAETRETLEGASFRDSGRYARDWLTNFENPEQQQG